MSASTTLAHAALKDLEAALQKVNKMPGNAELINTIAWEIAKPIESLEDWLDGSRLRSSSLQDELGFD